MSGRAVTLSGRATAVSGVSLGTALLPAFTGTTAGAAQHAPRTERVSTAADGTQGDDASSAAVTTPNGRYVAFRSSATTLVPEGVTHPDTSVSAGPQDSTRDMDPSTVVQLSANGRVLAMDSADGTYVRDLRTSRVQHFPSIRVLVVSPFGRRLLTRGADANLTPRGPYGGREIPVGHGSATTGSLSTVDADVVPGGTNGMYDVFQWRSS